MTLKIQLPAVVRSALRDARNWFAQVGVTAADLDLLKIEATPAPHHPGCEFVGLTFERGLRFYVVYRVEPGTHNFYDPQFVQLWQREQEGYEGHPTVWSKWQWEPQSELAKVA